MGVSGCGKSSVGRRLAEALALDFVEGDELHPPANVQRMAAGIALTDSDRQGWLESIAGRIGRAQQAGRGLVVACSALRRSYRDLLRTAAPDLRFVHLHGDPALLALRMKARPGHYMPASLLQSQLDALEPPGADEAPMTFDIATPPQDIVAEVRRRLQEPAA